MVSYGDTRVLRSYQLKITEDQTEALKKRETASLVTTDLSKGLRSSGILPTRIDALITFVCEHQDRLEKVLKQPYLPVRSSCYNSGLVTASSLTTMVGKFTYNIRYAGSQALYISLMKLSC